MLQRSVNILLLLCLLIGHNSAKAHQQKEAYTTVLFNTRTANMEINHRFSIHDAEHVLSSLFSEESDLAYSETTRVRFSGYIQQHFQLATAQETVSLKYVGHELDGKYFWVYQEAPITDSDILKIKHSSLQEIWPKQINHINVEKDGWVKSLRLADGDSKAWNEISLTKERDTTQH